MKSENGLPQVLIELAKASGHILDENWIVDIGLVVHDLERNQVLDLAHNLGQHAKKSWICLGAALLAVNERGLWHEEDTWKGQYTSFEDFVKKVCGFGLRQAQYMMRTYQLLAIKKIPWEKVQNAEFSKLQYIAQFANLDNIDEWVEKAKSLTVKQIKAELHYAVYGALAHVVVPDTFQHFQNEVDFAGTKDAETEVGKLMKANTLAEQAISNAKASSAPHKPLESPSDLLSKGSNAVGFNHWYDKPALVERLEKLMIEAGREQVLISFNKLFPTEQQ